MKLLIYLLYFVWMVPTYFIFVWTNVVFLFYVYIKVYITLDKLRMQQLP